MARLEARRVAYRPGPTYSNDLPLFGRSPTVRVVAISRPRTAQAVDPVPLLDEPPLKSVVSSFVDEEVVPPG